MPAAGAMRSVRAVAGVDRLQQDALFLQQLQLTKCGRVLQDHASCVLHRVDRGGHEGAIEECSNWRRTFIYGLNKALAEGKPAPFGLPLPVGRRVLPKYIAIVNLSGERMLLYSEQDTLLRMLCSVSHTQHAESLARGLNALAEHVECYDNPACKDLMLKGVISENPRSVLVCYSMQWQAGFESYYWEASTVEVLPCPPSSSSLTAGQSRRRVVVDRQMVLSSLSTETFEAHPTLGPRGVEELACGNQLGTSTYVGAKTVTEFSEQMSAASLDDAQRRARPLTSEEQERVHRNALAASDAEVHRIERGDGAADPLVVQLKIARETLATVQTQRDEHERLRVRAESERARVEAERDEEVKKSLRVLEELESVKTAIAAAEESRGRKQRRTADAESVEPVTLENAAIVSSSELEALERRVADANSLVMRREEEIELLNKKLKKATEDERKKNKVSNAALAQKDAQIKQLKERREDEAKAAKAAATEAREAREADARQAATHKEALEARLHDKDRVISQLGENLHKIGRAHV